MSFLRVPVLLLAVALVAAACGGGAPVSEESVTTTGPAAGPAGTAAPAAEAPPGSSESTASTTAPEQPSPASTVPSTGGTATLTVGDRVWEFQTVLCTFGEEQTGQEGAEFTLSAIQDGLQLYASIDSWGHSVSLNDIADFDNPSVALEASPSLFGGEDEEFIEISGKSVYAAGTFYDTTSDAYEQSAGSLVADCP